MTDKEKQDLKAFKEAVDKYRYDYCKLAYIIFPFGEKDTPLEDKEPYDWQMEEWAKLSLHMQNPVTRYQTYRLIISSGNGAAKTAFGAMTNIMLMYTHRYRGRLTANTDPQVKSIIWPEYDIWFRNARYHDKFFDKFGTSIKAKAPGMSEVWRLDTVNWSEEKPASISGLHNKGGVAAYTFEEAAGIPADIWKYAQGAFTETNTIKIFMAFANSDDPESYFEQCMDNPLWNSRRIDTRTLSHIDQKFVSDLLQECGGNEDHDDFRVRVRGLPRKASADAIVRLNNVEAAIKRRKDFDVDSIPRGIPTVLGCDPAWRGGDETVISMRRGQYVCVLERYKLDKEKKEDHMITYNRLCHWERELQADAVFIDQAEGTGIYTLANNNMKSWELVSFAQSPTDMPDSKQSEYANIRAMMYYKINEFCFAGGVLDSRLDEKIENGQVYKDGNDCMDEIKAQLCWTKGTRHKITGKKLAEPKSEIKSRVGKSPDISDSIALLFAREVTEKTYNQYSEREVGEGALEMPGGSDVYDSLNQDYSDLYD